MKTMTLFKKNTGKIIFFFCILLSSFCYSQQCNGNQVSITIENVITTSATTLEFDVFITNTGSTALSLAAIQGGVIYDNHLIDNDSQTTFTIVNKTSDFHQFNGITTKLSKVTHQLRWIQNPVSLSSGKSVNLPFQKKMKFATFRVTSTLPLQSNVSNKLIPQYHFKVGYTNLLATVYCDNNSDSIGLKSTNSEINTDGIENFNAIAYPNPYSENFHLDIQSAVETPIQIKVYDMLGKQIENKTIESVDLQNLSIGSNYPTGIYNINVSQGENTQTLRIIKR